MNALSDPLPITAESLATGAGDAPGEFPIQCLPPRMRAIVLEAAKQSRTPHSMSVVVALATISAAIGRSVMVKSGGSRRTTANLYCHSIARSGTGKTTTFDLVIKPLREAETKAIKNWTVSRKSCIESGIEVAKIEEKQLIAKLGAEKDEKAKNQLKDSLAAVTRDRQILEKELSSPPCFVVGNITGEALAAKMEHQPGEALFNASSEARGILEVIMGRYNKGGSDEDIYVAGYSGDSYKVNRIGRTQVSLNHPCLAILWMTQPDAAQKLFEDERMTVSGFMPRFLICNINAEPQYEPEEWPEMNPNVVQLWANLVNEILVYRAAHAEPDVIGATKNARDVFRTFHNQAVDRIRGGGDLIAIDSYVARWAENAWRVALVLHVTKYGGDAGRGPIDEATAKEAVEIMQWFIAQQLTFLDAFRPRQSNVRLEKLLAILREAGGGKTMGVLRDANNFAEFEVQSLVEKYPQQLIIEKLQQPGRPSYMVRIVQSPANTPAILNTGNSPFTSEIPATVPTIPGLPPFPGLSDSSTLSEPGVTDLPPSAGLSDLSTLSDSTIPSLPTSATLPGLPLIPEPSMHKSPITERGA